MKSILPSSLTSNLNKQFVVFLWVFIALNIFTITQLSAIDKIDTRGKEFYVSFIPNYHNARTNINQNDVLTVYIASEKTCVVTLRATNVNGQVDIQTVNITQPNTVKSITYSPKLYALSGYNNYKTVDLVRGKQEQVVMQHIYISSTEDITVYASDYADLTTDAFMVLPNHMLGKEYMVMSYNSDVSKDFFGGSGISENSTPSQYAVTASEDNTTVTLINKEPSIRYKEAEHTIILNKGQSYLVQADPNIKGGRGDLTGSIVKSDKPVAVFAGQQRATVPYDIGINNASRDLLVEQCTPTRYWGKNAIVSPLPLPKYQNKLKNDLFRVLALYDSTDIFLNDRLIKTINSGEYFQGFLDSAYFITSSAPISVGVYKKTTSDGSNSANYFGDPYLAIMPPVEQYHNVYLSTNIQVNIRGENKFTEHYVTVYLADSISKSLTIDGVPVNSNLFKKVGHSDYVYGDFSVSEGSHKVMSSGKVGILVSGYGPANSYGYLGGISQYPIDFNRPKIYSNQICDQIEITATDSLELDEGIAGVEVLEEENILLDIPLQNLPAPVYTFKILLKDPTKDGRIVLRVKDGSNSWVTREYSLNAVNVAVDPTDDALDGKVDNLYTVSEQMPENRQKCYQFTLKNYSMSDFNFNQIKSIHGKAKISNISVTRINKRADLLVKFCIESNVGENGIISDTIVIDSDCLTFPLAVVNYEVHNDGDAPEVIATTGNCEDFEINITDNGVFDRGIAKVEIVEQENCNVAKTKDGLDVKTYKVTIIDKSKDMYVRFDVIDSAGNKTSYEKLIQGFTLSLNSNSSVNLDKSEVQIKPSLADSYTCSQVKLYNFGKRDMILDELSLVHSTYYYLPKSQFPLRIPAGGSNDLYVCFQSQEVADKYTDSIKFNYNCQEFFLGLETGQLEDLLGVNKCGAEFTIHLDGNEINFGRFFPNPSVDRTSAIITSSKNVDYTYQIFDYLGNQVLASGVNSLIKGENLIDIDVEHFTSGLYLFKVNIAGQSLNHYINIVK